MYLAEETYSFVIFQGLLTPRPFHLMQPLGGGDLTCMVRIKSSLRKII